MQQEHGVIKLNEMSCWKMIKAYLNTVNKTAAKPLNSFNSFCRTAIGYTENLKGVDINETLVEFVIGRNLSASLSEQSQSNLFNSNNDLSLKVKEFSTCTKKSNNSKKTAVITHEIAYEPLLNAIREAIKKHDTNGRKVSQAKCQDNIEDILTNYNVPISCIYLLEWFNFLLNKNKVSTINTYFSSIGMFWIANTVGIDPVTFDEHELESLYSSMLDGEFTDRARAYKKGRLKQLHIFCHRQFGFSYLESFDSDKNSGLRGFVRSEFIAEHQFSSIINAVDDITNIDHIVDNDTLKCILIIAYRSGMRISEILKLRLHDVENSEDLWAYILNTILDNNKSYAAIRKLPLALLFTKKELTFVQAFFSRRLSQTNNDKNTLLFSEQLNEYVAIDKQGISKIFKFIASQLFEVDLTFHHLRHSALSKLQLIIEGDTAFIEQVTTYTKEQIKNIQYTLGSYHRVGVNKDKYWALAGIAGHNTPETTLHSYLHFTDRLLGKQLANFDKMLSKDELKNTSGLSVRKINNTFQGRNQIHIKEAVLLIEKSLTKNSYKIEANNRKRTIDKLGCDTNLVINPKMNHGLNACLSALKLAEAGATTIEICNQLSINEVILKKWLVNAQHLSTLTTTKGKPRLFSPQKVTTVTGLNLLPPMVVSNVENKDVSLIIASLRKIFKQNKNKVLHCLEYFLAHKNHESPRLSFKSPKELKVFTHILAKILPKSRIKLSFTPLHNIEPKKLLAGWASSINKGDLKKSTKVMKNKNLYPYGKMELFLSHPEEQDLIKSRKVRQYSTNSLGFVFHMLAIMTLDFSR